MGVLRTGIRGFRGVYRSGKLCDQYRRWEPVWVSAALGAAVVECDGHSDPVPFGQAWYCHRAYAAAELPEAFFAADDAFSLDSGGDLGDFDRSGRVSGGGAGVLSAG